MVDALLDFVPILWFLLLVPFFVLLFLVVMAFDGGSGLKTWTLVLSVWSYPAVLGLAMFLRRRKPLLILLPVVNLIAFFATAFGTGGIL